MRVNRKKKLTESFNRHIRSSQEADISVYLNKDTKLGQLVQSMSGKRNHVGR